MKSTQRIVPRCIFIDRDGQRQKGEKEKRKKKRKKEEPSSLVPCNFVPDSIEFVDTPGTRILNELARSIRRYRGRMNVDTNVRTKDATRKEEGKKEKTGEGRKRFTRDRRKNREKERRGQKNISLQVVGNQS